MPTTSDEKDEESKEILSKKEESKDTVTADEDSKKSIDYSKDDKSDDLTPDMIKLESLVAQQSDFEKMYRDWLAKYDTWKKGNALHPAAPEVAAQWEGWKTKLLERRELVQRIITETLERISQDRLKKSGTTLKEEKGGGDFKSIGESRKFDEDEILEVAPAEKKSVVTEVITLDEDSDMDDGCDDLLHIPRKPVIKEERVEVRVKQEPKSESKDLKRHNEIKKERKTDADDRRDRSKDSKVIKREPSDTSELDSKNPIGGSRPELRDDRPRAPFRRGVGDFRPRKWLEVTWLEKAIPRKMSRNFMESTRQCKDFIQYLDAFDELYSCKKEPT